MRVVEIFPSLQGEGVWAGTPMTFVRLEGCNAPEEGLACVEWCDTREAWAGSAGTRVEELTAEQVADQVDLPRACFTGGEPLLQYAEVGRAVQLLRSSGVSIHVETNGTIAPCGEGEEQPIPFTWSTVSPKPPEYRVAEGWEGAVDELKFVVDNHFSCDAVFALERRFPQAAVCLQPEAGGGRAAVAEAVELVQDHPRWRLSLQLHKILGLP